MEQNNEKLNNNSQEIVRNEKGQLAKGVVLNPNGRPKGSEDFKTKFYKMVDKIAKNNSMTPEEIEEQLFMVGYKKAKDGDYSFYRDLMDRVHGRPVNKNEHTGADGKDLPTPILGTYVSTNNITQENINDETQDTSSTEEISEQQQSIIDTIA